MSCFMSRETHGCSRAAFLLAPNSRSPAMAGRLHFVRLTGRKEIKGKRGRSKLTVRSTFVTDGEKRGREAAIPRDTRTKQKKLSDTWREMHGQDDWAGLLDPFDPLLRAEVIRYGEMAQACYDAFDYDPYSKYCGSCRYKPGELFQALGSTKEGYEVTRYLFATYNANVPKFFRRSRWPQTWSQKANWIGFVSVSNDETSVHLGRRDIAIAWRGTMTNPEIIADLMNFLSPAKQHSIPSPDLGVKIESGFLDLYTEKDESCIFCKLSARELVLREVKRLMEQYEDEDLSITITGHSLGSAHAILNAYDIAETGINIRRDGSVVPVCVFSFAGPRVGNHRFKKRVKELGVKVLRVVNIHDKVPDVPGIFFNENTPAIFRKLGEMSPWSYAHVGEELALDHTHSPFLKETRDLSCFHNLEVYLHLLDGYHGKGEQFLLRNGRDIALVNKTADLLKEHYLIPPNWWQTENKGLKRNHDGRWAQLDRPCLSDHVVEDGVLDNYYSSSSSS